MPIHQYFKFIKYGYSRATDHACYEIRQGRMTGQAKELIIEYEGKVPRRYFKEFLEFLDIDEKHFFQLSTDLQIHFFLKNNKSLYLEIRIKIWYLKIFVW